MQLLKKREFGDYFNDTFEFIRNHGKHYFKNYFIINGIPLAILLLIIYFFVTSFYGLSSFQTDTGAIVEDYFNKNFILSVFVIVVSVIFLLLFAILQYSYTPVYLILYQKKQTHFTANDIITFIFKEKLSKILIFFLAGLVLLIPVGIVMTIAVAITLITIVGVFIPIAAVSLWFSMAFISYLSLEQGVWKSFGYAWDMLFHQFWKNTASVAAFIILTMIVNTGISLLASSLTAIVSFNTIDASDKSVITIISLVLTFVITKAISIFLQTINQLFQNIIYFSIKETRENIAGFDQIDQIGLGEE